MKKPERLQIKLLCLAVFALLLLIWYRLDLPCVLRTLSGIPCPTCGLTRAWLYALQLDLKSAFLQYPMFWSIPVLMLFLLFDGSLFPSSKINHGLLGILIAGIFLTWLARLFGFLGTFLPL